MFPLCEIESSSVPEPHFMNRPVSPGDVMATIYRLLGVQSTTQILDSLGRPHEVVPHGRVLHEIMG